jgi:acyl-CoA thioester hydrolase
MFEYQHRVQFYETDPMAIVHHSNYLRFYEEARIHWALQMGMMDFQSNDASRFAVIGADVRYLKPAFFGDVVDIQVQARLLGSRIIFEYKMFCKKRNNQLLSEARTEHVHIDSHLRPRRPDEKLKTVMEKQSWIETWLLSL